MRCYIIKSRSSSKAHIEVGVSASTPLVVSLGLRVRTASHHSILTIFIHFPISAKSDAVGDVRNALARIQWVESKVQ